MSEDYLDIIKKYTLYFCLFLLIYLFAITISWLVQSSFLLNILPNIFPMSLLSTILFILLLASFVLHQITKTKLMCKVIPAILSAIVLSASIFVLIETFVEGGVVIESITGAEDFNLYIFKSPPLTAFTFTFISTALLLYVTEVYKSRLLIFVFCLALPIMLSFLSVIGYVLGLNYFLGFTGFKAIAITSSILFIFLSIILLIHPEEKIQFSIPLKRRLLIIFIPFLIISFGFTVYTFRSLQEQKKDSELVEHTLKVQRQINQIHADIEDLSVNYHRYVFFKDDNYYQGFIKTKENLKNEISVIDSFVVDSEIQTNRLKRLSGLIIDYIVNSQNTMEQYKNTKSTDVLDAQIWTQEDEQMTAINDLLYQMFQHEDDLLTHRSDKFEYSTNITKFVVATGSIFSSILLLFLYTAFRTDYRTQKQSNELIARERDFARNIIDTISDSLLVLDEDYEIQTVNESFCQVFKIEASEVIDKSIYEIGRGEWDQPEVRRLLEEVIPVELSYFNYEINFKSDVVGKKVFSLNCTQLHNKSSRKKTLLLVIRDVTARKNYERQLKEYADELSDLYNYAPVGYHSIDANGVITRINDMELEWLGYSREEVVNKMKFTDFLNEDGAEKFNKNFPEFKRTGSVHDLEFEIQRKDGSSFSIVVNATAIKDENGNYISSRSTVFDITERKRFEDEMQELNESLKKREEMLSTANKELEAFSYSVSHDLRAPLRHINGFIKLIKSKSEAFDETTLKYFNIISDSAQLMGKLIDDLLAFSRIGRAEINKTEVDSNILVQKVIATLKPELKKRNIEWKISELPVIYADEGLMYSVFANFISNAVKYTGKKEEAVIDISSHYENGDVIFCIADNGTGFDMKYVDKLFGVFQRLHSNHEFEGTGIGLALIKRIIMKHEGKAWAEGKVNEGAKFYFSLPQVEEDE